MSETRDKKINKKVLSKKHIWNIWRVIDEEHQSSKNQKNHSTLDLEFNCEGARYSSESSELLKDGDIIDLKKIESISIKYYDYKLNRRIDVSLRNGDYGNSYIVKGNDRNWVAGIFDRLGECFDAVDPQDHWFITYNKTIFHLVAIIFGFFIARWMILFITPSPDPSTIIDIIRSNKFYHYAISLLIYWVVGYIPSAISIDWVNKLWPSVEFDFGPEHTKLQKNKRNRLIIFFTVILTSFVVPFLMSYVGSLIFK